MLIWDADLNKNNEIHSRYLMGSGYLGLQKTEEAEQEFNAKLKLNSNHLSTQIHNKLLTTTI